MQAARSGPDERVGIVAFVAHEWGSPWSTPHFTMTRLAYHHPVVWVEPPGAFGQKAVRRAPGSFRRNWAPYQFQVYVPERWLPVVHRFSRIGRALARLRAIRAIGHLRRMGSTRFVAYAWRPDFLAEFESPRFFRRCYHIDDEYTFSSDDPPIPEPELRMLRSADTVFVAARSMFEKKGHVNPRSFLAPNGVDYDLYATMRPEPEDLAAIPRPRIGYTGWLKRQLDWELIERVVDRRPDDSFVFVGPVSPHAEIQGNLERLGRRANVHFLGRKQVDVLAAYPQHFDVCLMPYVHNGYTKYIDPLKLHEYLASGSPVVATPLPSLRPYDGLIELAVGPDAWDAAIARSLLEDRAASGRGEARRKVAKEHDWARLVERIVERIGGREIPAEGRDR